MKTEHYSTSECSERGSPNLIFPPTHSCMLCVLSFFVFVCSVCLLVRVTHVMLSLLVGARKQVARKIKCDSPSGQEFLFYFFITANFTVR